MTLFAHAGHWLVSLAEFLPVLLFVAWLGWITLRERRRGGEAAGDGSPE